MIKFRAFMAVLMLGVLAYPFQASAHGGGCRKDSPPGKCCHKDSKTGTVHCH